MSLICLEGVGLSDHKALLRHWQREPCLLSQAVEAAAYQLDPDDLIDIITETTLPSRLITGAEGHDFTLRRGPFENFTPPDDGPWTVLIQAMEQLIPEFAALRDEINWLPAWRFEDCMLSWANTGGSVGRHVDQFSVFLVQLNGRRQWDIGPKATSQTPHVVNQPISLVAPTEPDASITTHPGDVLYIPPGVIHHGVALDANCMTLSIGFRAPSVGELFESLLETLDETAELHRFEDANRPFCQQAAEITAEDVQRVRQVMIDQLEDDQRLARILAERVTTPYLEIDASDKLTDSDVTTLIEQTPEFELDCGVRVAYFESTLYINGECCGQDIPLELVELANQRRIQRQQIEALSPHWRTVLFELIQDEHLIPAEDPSPTDRLGN